MSVGLIVKRPDGGIVEDVDYVAGKDELLRLLRQITRE